MNNYSQARYFEKTLKESHINIFRSLEIENYLKQLLKKKEFNLHSYRLNFSNSVLQILISTYKKTTPHRKNSRFIEWIPKLSAFIMQALSDRSS